MARKRVRLLAVAAACAAVGLAGPYFKMLRDRRARIEKFEEQLPDAIDSMKRALRAGSAPNASPSSPTGARPSRSVTARSRTS